MSDGLIPVMVEYVASELGLHFTDSTYIDIHREGITEYVHVSIPYSQAAYMQLNVLKEILDVVAMELIKGIQDITLPTSFMTVKWGFDQVECAGSKDSNMYVFGVREFDTEVQEEVITFSVGINQ